MFQVTGAFAEFERSMIRQRVHAGLKRAVDAGKQLGRPRIDPALERRNPESNCGPARACSRLPPSAALAAVRFSVSGGRWLGRPALSKAQARPRKATIRRANTGVMNSIRPCCERRCALLLGRQPSLHRNKSSYALVNKKLIGSLVL